MGNQFNQTNITGQLVRCEACGRSKVCTPDDLLRYTQRRWPTCCGAVMTYYRAADRPGKDGQDDTKLDRPAVSPP